MSQSDLPASGSLREKALSLPLSPGVYLFSDKNGDIIYIGKAKVLKNRVSSYFHSNLPSPKVRAMVASAAKLDYIVTATEFEAFVLESSLIKRHKPHFNILLKDDKGYPFVRVDMRESCPSLALAPKKLPDGASYYGPFGSRGATLGLIDAIGAALRMPLCSRVFPRDIGKGRPCLHYHTGRCCGACVKGFDAAELRRSAERAVTMLKGDYSGLASSLRAEMEQASDALEFERAARLRDILSDVERLGERQKIVTSDRGRLDVVGCHVGPVRTAFSVLSVLSGVVAAQSVASAVNGAEESSAEALSSFLRQYYADGSGLPDCLLLPFELEDGELLARFFSEERGSPVRVEYPKRGANHQLLLMAMENARRENERTTTDEEKLSAAVSELARLIGVPSPRRIESYDISNTQSSGMVGAMVVFANGRPLKSAYKRFSIRTLSSPDDCAATAEVVGRRFSDEAIGSPPDLILADGGIGQVNAIAAVLAEKGLQIPLFGMVKDGRHRTRALVNSAGEEISLEGSPAAFALAGSIQEEVHRFALAYHRVKRKKQTLVSELDELPGVGPKRKAALLKAFGSVAKIKSAGPDELAAVLPKPAAQAVYARYHTENPENPTKGN